MFITALFYWQCFRQLNRLDNRHNIRHNVSTRMRRGKKPKPTNRAKKLSPRFLKIKTNNINMFEKLKNIFKEKDKKPYVELTFYDEKGNKNQIGFNPTSFTIDSESVLGIKITAIRKRDKIEL